MNRWKLFGWSHSEWTCQKNLQSSNKFNCLFVRGPDLFQLKTSASLWLQYPTSSGIFYTVVSLVLGHWLQYCSDSCNQYLQLILAIIDPFLAKRILGLHPANLILSWIATSLDNAIVKRYSNTGADSFANCKTAIPNSGELAMIECN